MKATLTIDEETNAYSFQRICDYALKYIKENQIEPRAKDLELIDDILDKVNWVTDIDYRYCR